MHCGRSPPNQLPAKLGGDISPSIFFGVLLENEACPEDGDGQLGIEEETVGKERND